jgi:hypothetical protein
MKLRRLLAHHASHSIKILKKRSGSLGVLFLLVALISTFLITRGVVPLTSELSYTEHSSLGKDAGSVVPASCDSGSPFTSPTAAGGTAGSHFAGDCTTACPGGVGVYDPYFDDTLHLIYTLLEPHDAISTISGQEI